MMYVFFVWYSTLLVSTGFCAVGRSVRSVRFALADDQTQTIAIERGFFCMWCDRRMGGRRHQKFLGEQDLFFLATLLFFHFMRIQAGLEDAGFFVTLFSCGTFPFLLDGVAFFLQRFLLPFQRFLGVA